MIQLSHRGVCVTDVERSERFYCDALGFEPYMDYGILEGPDMDKTMQLSGVRLRMKMLKHVTGPVIELLHFLSPEATGPRERRSTLQYGLVHFSFYVDDIEAVTARIVQAGGKVIEESRAYYADNDITLIYCTDPDGVRVELMQKAGEPARFSHSGINVHDIDVSMRYYEALGFKPAEDWVLDAGYDWLGKLNEVPGIKLRTQMIRDAQGNTIELLKVFEPECFGTRERQPLNRYGLTHLAFWDDTPDVRVAQLTERGGYFVEEARVTIPAAELLHGADPDGIRIELMRKIEG